MPRHTSHATPHRTTHRHKTTPRDLLNVPPHRLIATAWPTPIGWVSQNASWDAASPHEAGIEAEEVDFEVSYGNSPAAQQNVVMRASCEPRQELRKQKSTATKYQKKNQTK